MSLMAYMRTFHYLKESLEEPALRGESKALERKIPTTSLGPKNLLR